MRRKGTVKFSSNFEVYKDAPLDARELVEYYEDLYELEAGGYCYIGQIVSVQKDSLPETSNMKAGLYRYVGTNTWEKIMSTGDQYVLPKATNDSLGGVKIGDGIDIGLDGKISVNKKIYEVEWNDVKDKPSSLVYDLNYTHTDNNFSDAYKEKLEKVNEDAEVNVQSDWAEEDSENDAYIKSKPTKLSDFSFDIGEKIKEELPLPEADSETYGVVKIGKGLFIDEEKTLCTKLNRMPYVYVPQGEFEKELVPGIFYDWGEDPVEELKLTLATPEEEDVVNDYRFRFVSGETPTALTLPSDIILEDDLGTYWTEIKSNIYVVMEPFRKYEISIINKYAKVTYWSLSKSSIASFYIKNLTEGMNDVTITSTHDDIILDLMYKVEGETNWTKLEFVNRKASFRIKPRKKVYLKGNNKSTSKNSLIYNTITASKDFAIGGNLNKLLSNTTNLGKDNKNAFAYLFRNNVNLKNIDELILPSKSLSESCYESLFDGCTSLINVPEGLLPANNLAKRCYFSMFRNCKGLKNVPRLRSKFLADFCYEDMFDSCDGLEEVPEDLLLSKNLCKGCYAGMFSECINLKKAPKLDTLKLAESCYNSMFEGCRVLKNAPELPATELEIGCYFGMFSRCYEIEKAPDLLAENLVTGCYSNMFEGCFRLNEIKAMFLTDPSSTYTSDWIKGVSQEGTFYKNEDATWSETGTGFDGIPRNWNIVKVKGE